jgi:hypothetical protein
MPAQDQRFDMRLGSPNWFKTIAEGLEEQRRGMTDDRGRNPIKKMGVVVRIKIVKLRGPGSRRPRMRKVSVDEAVRMLLRALVLMNVLKRRLQERKRQHEVHQDRNASSHRHILPTYLFLGTLLLY